MKERAKDNRRQSAKKRRMLALATCAVAVVLAIIINAPGIFSIFYRIDFGMKVNSLRMSEGFSRSDRVLIVAPHPDDEVLACAGSILAARRAGAEVFVIWVTSGDAFEWDEVLLSRHPVVNKKEMAMLGLRRMAEAREAVTGLGIPRTNCFFLGYPDGGILALWKENYTKVYTSKYTGAKAVPYQDCVTYGAEYTGRSLEKNLKNLVTKVSPTVVLAPSPYERHRDHRAVSFFVTRVLQATRVHARLEFYMVHGGAEWPIPKGWHTNLPLPPPPRGKHEEWRRVDLGEEDVQRKVEAIRAYKSQMDALGRFMAAFARTNELLAVHQSKE